MKERHTTKFSIIYKTIFLTLLLPLNKAEIDSLNRWQSPLIIKAKKIMEKRFKTGNTINLVDVAKEDENLMYESLIKITIDLEPRQAVVISNKNVKIFRHQPRDINILVSLKTCKDLFDMAKQTSPRIVAYVIAITTHDNISNCRQMIREKEEYFTQQNLTIISHEANYVSSIQIVAGVNTEHGKTKHNKTQGTLHLTYTKSNSKNSKMKALRVGVIDQPPYVTVPNKSNLATYEKVCDAFGSDIETVKIIARYLNMTIELYFLKRFGENNDEYYANNTIIQLFEAEKLEVATGGLYFIYGDQVDYSDFYMIQLIFWVYSIQTDSRSWVLFLTRIHGYYIFILFYVAHSLVGYLFNYNQRIEMTLYDSFFLSWGALLGCGSLAKPRNWRERFTSLFYSILCLYFAAYLSVQLYEFLTITPPPTRYNNNNAIMASGKNPCMWPPLKNFNEDEQYIEFTKNHNHCDGFLDCARCIVRTNGVTPLMTSTYDTIQNIIGMEAGEARLQRTQENLLTAFQVMILRKNNPINTYISKAVTRLFEAGIYAQLFKQSKGLTSVWRAQMLSENSLKNSYTCTAGCKITIDQTAGLFYLLFSGWILSILAFTAEVLWAQKIIKIIFSSDTQSARVLRWISDNSPVQVNCLDQVWRHGWLVCGLLEQALPGACGGHSNAEASIEHAQTLVEQYLGVQPVFSRQELESTESLSKHQEWRLAQYLDQVRQALDRLSPPVSKPNTPRKSVQEIQAYTLDYVVRGMGLCTAQTNRKMCFKIYPTAQQCLEPGEINVLIRGPGDTFGTVLIPPIYGRSQILRQAFLGINLKQKYTEGSLPLTHGAAYLRTYGKNDMNKTFYIPKIKQDVDIEISIRRDHTRVTYTAKQDGTYEISLTSRGYNLIGSPYRVSASADSVESNTSSELNDDECRVIDVKSDRRVVLRIVDFVTEKMVLNDNGSLEKITDEEAMKLINNTKPLSKPEKTSNKFQQLDLIEQDIKTNYCAHMRFKDVANKIIKMVEVCNSFKGTTGQVKVYSKLEENIKSHSEIPDIVHSTIFDKKQPVDDVTDINENITNEIRENDSIETKQKDKVVISFHNDIGRRRNSEIHNNEIIIENIDQCNHTIIFNDNSTDQYSKTILNSRKCVEAVESPENIVQKKLCNTFVDDYEKEEQSKSIPINPFVCDVREHENILEPEIIKLLQEPSSKTLFKNDDFNEYATTSTIESFSNKLALETENKIIPKFHESESSMVKYSESLSLFNPFQDEYIEPDYSLNELLTNKYVISEYIRHEQFLSKNMTNSLNPLQSDKDGIATISSVNEISNNHLTEIDNDQFNKNQEESYDTETTKSQGNSITSINPFHNESFEEYIIPPTIESPIKIQIETDNEEPQVHTNPFADAVVVERPKTPILKIITGEVKGTNDSFYVGSNLRLPDEVSFDDELRNSNEFLNPFYVNTIYQNTMGDALITPPPMTDFLIGAPVSLPPFFKAPSPEPDMESIILASNLEEALNKFDKKLQDVKQSESAEPGTIFSTPVSLTPTLIIEKRSPIEEKCCDKDSSFCSSEHCVKTNYVECMNELIKVPQKELWDSAYVSIDEPSSSPDSNNNNESVYKTKITDNNNFDIPPIDFVSMGPAEREIWQKYANDNSELSDLLQHDKNPTAEHKRSVFSTILEDNENGTPTISNDFYKESEKKVQTSEYDSITEVLTELNDIYKEYYSSSDGTLYEIELEKEKFQSLEVNFSLPGNEKYVDSASETKSDVKRHIEDEEAATISEVQSYATESFSVSQALEKQNENITQQNEGLSMISDVKTFGDKPTGNLVSERKLYWDEKIKVIEEMKQEEERKQRKRKIPSKHLKLNDSIGKQNKGTNIANNFINAVESINCENQKVLDTEFQEEHVEPTNEQQTEIKLVDKWKKFWDEKLVTTEEFRHFPVTEKKMSESKKSMSPVTLSSVKNIEALIQSESGDNSPEEILTQPEIHSPIKIDITDEKLFEAFETSPKRFFGNSRRNILDRIDAFLGPTIEDKKPIDLSITRTNIGIVSSRISMFDINKSDDYIHKQHTHTFSTNMGRKPSISETYLNKISNIDNVDNSSIPKADFNYQNSGPYEKIPICKDPAKIKNKIDKFRKSTSKSEMDLFNIQHNKPDDFDVHKSYEDLYSVNVKNFISLFENQAELKVDEALLSVNHSSNSLKDVSVQPQNADNYKVLNEQHHIVKKAEKTEHLNISNESIEAISEASSLNSDVKDAPINEKAKEDIDSRTANKHPGVEFRESFKKAKLFFQSLEELGSDVSDKEQKLNECEMLLYNHTESSNTTTLKKQKKVKAHSAPPSYSEYEPNSVEDQSDSNGTGGGVRKLTKISEKFQVEDLFKDVAGDGTLSRRGSFRGIPHKQAVLATFKSMENIWHNQLSSYEMSKSQLSDYAKENNVKNAQTYLNEYPYLPKTDPSMYRSRLDSRASGLISREELLKPTRPRRNSVPDTLRLNESFTVHM